MIDKCIGVTKNLSNNWVLTNIDNKVSLQKLIFPNGIVVDPIKRQYRTSKVNQVFSAIASISSDNKPESKNAPSVLDDASSLVAGAGFISHILWHGKWALKGEA